MSLGKLTVNGRQDGFLCEGKPFFWFADTCWSAFTSITEADWDYYLTRRAEQGMNVLQINTLPQWDRCCPDLGIWPYASEDGVHFDWSVPTKRTGIAPPPCVALPSSTAFVRRSCLCGATTCPVPGAP